MLNQLLQELPHQTNILEATFGLEREGLRITESGQIATTDHPVCLGSRSFHPYIQTDFSEEQLELITPISYSTSQARRRLGAIWDVTQASLAKKKSSGPYPCPLTCKTRISKWPS